MNSNNIKQSVVKLETPLSFGSVCSGIEAASVAWEPLGWRASWFAEIEPFPSAVLAYHWPQVTNLGDMTKIRERVTSGEVSAPDVLVGGTPCQAFSVAGARKSLSDDRGQLTLEYVRLLNEIDAARSIQGEQPAIAVWENVPGVLNTKDNAFGCLLGALAGEECELQPSGKKWGNAGCVFGPQRAVAWRVLDAQYFGVAQRRRRVFVVASAREGFNPAEVLFEFDGVRRDSAPCRSAWQEATASAGNSTESTGGTISGKQIFPTLQASMGSKLWLGNQEAFSGDYFVVHGTQDPLTQDNQAFPLGRNHGQENVVFSIQGNTVDRNVKQNGSGISIECAHTLNTQDRHAVAFGIQGNMIGRSISAGPAGSGISDNIGFTLTKGDRHAVAYAFDSLSSNSMKSKNPHSGCRKVDLAKTLDTTDPNPSKNQGGIGILHGLVRRLTPVECERLQGFPSSENKYIIQQSKDNDCLLCLDHQKSHVHFAATQNHKSQKHASHAENVEPLETVLFVGSRLSINLVQTNKHARLNAVINCEGGIPEPLSLKKLQLIAEIAEKKSNYHHQMQIVGFARIAAHILLILENKTHNGKEVFQGSAINLTKLQNGSELPKQYGIEIMQLVKSAEINLTTRSQLLKFIISYLSNTKITDQELVTLFYFAVSAIISLIQKETKEATFCSVEFITLKGHTQIPYRNKPAEQCPDGPRYAACGNSMAVPVMNWIGRRIQDVIMQISL